MKKYAYLIWVYSTLLIIGGLIGFLKAGSLPSIIASSSFSLALSFCGYGIWKNKQIAYTAALALLTFLLAFFGYRFSLNYQMMPAGMMILMTSLVLIPMNMGRKKFLAQNFS